MTQVNSPSPGVSHDPEAQIACICSNQNVLYSQINIKSNTKNRGFPHKIAVFRGFPQDFVNHNYAATIC